MHARTRVLHSHGNSKETLKQLLILLNTEDVNCLIRGPPCGNRRGESDVWSRRHLYRTRITTSFSSIIEHFRKTRAGKCL
eukprot:jgi/Botrbrau1/1158/Bobra.0162s0046.1